MNILSMVLSQIQKHSQKVKIIFPEGHSEKMQAVAERLVNEKTNVHPILVFKTVKEVPTNLNAGIEVLIVEQADQSKLANKLVELRNNKVTLDDAKKLVKEPNYFAVLMVKMGNADGMVGGIEYDTKDIIRPALQIIRPKSGYKLVGSIFLMIKGDENYLFTDCSLNINPTSEQVVDITKLAVEGAQLFNIKKPKVSLLSYSTKGSGAGESVDKMREAFNLLQKDPIMDKCIIDGEFQFDSAYDETVRAKKAPNSPIKGHSDIYVFPNLDAGNIAYKIAQRLAGYEAVGPILIGLDRPVNDLSRGATLDDIFNTVLVTAYLYLLNIKNK